MGIFDGIAFIRCFFAWLTLDFFFLLLFYTATLVTDGAYNLSAVSEKRVSAVVTALLEHLRAARQETAHRLRLLFFIHIRRNVAVTENVSVEVLVRIGGRVSQSDHLSVWHFIDAQNVFFVYDLRLDTRFDGCFAD